MVDLDGVLNDYTKEKFDKNFIPPIKKGAKEFLKELSKTARLYLFTTRNLLLVSKWLIDNKIDKYFENITNTKTPASIYIDDRAICFNGDFKQTILDVEEFQVYWDKENK